MTDSILDQTKALLSVPSTDTAFDQDIISAINTAFMTLNQMGVGPSDPLVISDSTTEWSAFSTDVSKFQAVKSYVYLTARLLFDPPGTSYHLDALARQKQEYEWRLSVQVPIPPTI